MIASEWEENSTAFWPDVNNPLQTGTSWPTISQMLQNTQHSTARFLKIGVRTQSGPWACERWVVRYESTCGLGFWAGFLYSTL